METVSDCLPLSSLFTNMFLYMYIYRLFWPALAFSMKEYNLICLSTVAPRIISLPNVFQTTWHWAGCETWPGNVDTNNKNGPKNGKLGSEWIQMKFKKRELSVNHWPVWFFFFPFSGRVKIKPVPQSRFITISIHLHIKLDVVLEIKAEPIPQEMTLPVFPVFWLCTAAAFRGSPEVQIERNGEMWRQQREKSSVWDHGSSCTAEYGWEFPAKWNP